LTFFSGVYGTCISNNMHFGDDAKGLIGISGMFIGAGEIIGKRYQACLLEQEKLLVRDIRHVYWCRRNYW
jgi:hypothetical protein